MIVNSIVISFAWYFCILLLSVIVFLMVFIYFVVVNKEAGSQKGFLFSFL